VRPSIRGAKAKQPSPSDVALVSAQDEHAATFSVLDPTSVASKSAAMQNAVAVTQLGLQELPSGRSLASIDLLVTEARIAMARGTYRCAQALMARGWFDALAPETGSLIEGGCSSARLGLGLGSPGERARFAHRFSAYGKLPQPNALQLHHLHSVLGKYNVMEKVNNEVKLSNVNQKVIIDEALREFKRVKPLVDRVQLLSSAPFNLPLPALWLSHLKAMQRIAVTNSVLLMRLDVLAEQASLNGQKLKVECDWTLSHVFPIFNLK
jgi:hypothetical protein